MKILFFGKSKHNISHVAMVFDRRHNLMIEAGGGDSRTVNINMAHAQGAMVRIRPISSRKDLVSVIMPEY